MTAAAMALHMLAIFYTASLVVSTGGIHFLLAGGDNFVSVAAKPARRQPQAPKQPLLRGVSADSATSRRQRRPACSLGEANARFSCLGG